MASLHEEWRTLKIGGGRFQVSSHGRVRCCGKNGFRMVAQANHNSGYMTARCGGSVPRLVHRLVAEAFIGPAPDGMDVNHIDGNKKNNCADNLEYVTRKENMQHAVRLGLMRRKGEDNPATKATNDQMRIAYNLVVGGVGVRQAAELAGVSFSGLRHLLCGSKWKSLGLPPVRLTPRNRVPESVKRQIIELRKSGATHSEIVDATNASSGTVYRVLMNA